MVAPLFPDKVICAVVNRTAKTAIKKMAMPVHLTFLL
jgi:hypothetical protein